MLRQHATALDFIDTNFELVRHFISNYKDFETIMSVSLQLRRKFDLTQHDNILSTFKIHTQV